MQAARMSGGLESTLQPEEPEFGVRHLQRPGGDTVDVEGEEGVTMFPLPRSFGALDERRDLASVHTADPVVEHPTSGALLHYLT